MAKFTTSAGIEDLTGKLDKQERLTMRQKKWKAPNGKIVKYGPKEVYSQEKRDFKRHPRVGAEAAQHSKWTEACREAGRIKKDPNHPRHQEMVARHAAQLFGKVDPVVGKRIAQFGNFICSVLIHE